MKQLTRTPQGLPQTTLRRLRNLRNTPTYFVLVWRWMAWVYALLYYLSANIPLQSVTIPLLITFAQALIATLYAPVFQLFLPRFTLFQRISFPGQKRTQSNQQRRWWTRYNQQPLAQDEEMDILAPVVSTRNPYGDIFIYGLDVIICGLITYTTAGIWNPPYGIGSPFYRYGLSSVLAASFAYRYRGGLAATAGYLFLIMLGAFLPLPGTPPFKINPNDLVGSVIDAPLISIIAAYLATLLESNVRSKRREQDNVRRQAALLHVSETLLEGARNTQDFLRLSAEQIRKGGHFERLIVALVNNGVAEGSHKETHVEIDEYIGVGRESALSGDETRLLLQRVAQSGTKLIDFEPLQGVDAQSMARIYLPLFKEGKVHVILGAENIRQTPFGRRHEEFLTLVGAQLLVALENIRLTEQAAELAAQAERGRIAREIHDGVAQLIYMLSLQTETCLALAQRIAEASDDGEELAPLTERLDRLVTISKQALWETRHYMFTLKPLMSGATTLTQMLTNLLHEFEVISGLPVKLEVEGNEHPVLDDQRQARKIAQVGTAIFRITQEALTNAYKHAQASELYVHLHYLQHAIEVEVRDNGKGMYAANDRLPLRSDGETQRILSGCVGCVWFGWAEELGGTFELIQADAGGVQIRINIPI